MDLAHSHIVVLGAGKRLGLFLTHHFLKAGAHISAFYRSPSAELTSLLDQFPSSLRISQFDLESPERVAPLMNDCLGSFGEVSGVVCVASQFYPTPYSQLTPQQWDELFATNVKGHFFFLQALIPFFKEPSHLLTLVDIFARKPLRNYLAYASAKGALLTMSRNFALELAPKTRVNSISPGPVLLPEDFTPGQDERQIQSTLLGRLGSPLDIWEATRFLFENNYVTGVDLRVDGGASLR